MSPHPSLRQVLTSPVTLLTYALFVVPFALGWLRSSWMSPLALPGYLVFVIGSAVGNAIAPRYEFWTYWMPFLVGCFGLSSVVGYVYERWRGERSDGE
ncbi:hypothetical protein HALLA_19165 [Halostagnicola larsenii XH-48]|uniref:Uncharacterized protein n=1 Tax=Halostagnicola larsenii XH-48 TaxID=797299 RepID=W0JPE4_9EURY|nr:hypothetical protein [Halostagnicola larsenii]AHG00596.1 hypothetical protein HALLA_19165 [Halostagnicola larsenii XH-48]